MAIINGQEPNPAPATQEATRRRVVVRMRPGVDARAVARAANEGGRESSAALQELTRSFPGLRFEPYFTSLPENPETGSAARTRTPAGRARASRLASYLAIEVPAGVSPEELARAAARLPDVDTAYPEGGPTPPPVNATDDPRSGNQGYLDPAPGGIDARWMWTQGGGDGAGVGVVDLEQGWTLTHEDLSAAGITLISGLNQAYHGHGTAVLGELVGVDNSTGGIGIAPVATARVVSQYRSASNYNTADAILSAVAAMQAGDVLLLEAQTTHANASGYLPVEVEDAVFDAIEFATSEGIVVVEAAGNGSEDLDALTDAAGKQILNRQGADFRDSGAIMVGAASSASPHQRLSFSNFGSRIDCFAWGQNVDTCGDGWTGQSTTAYTTSFGGTSSASPIVTGAAVLLQSWRVSQGQDPFAPWNLRGLLSDTQANTPSASPSTDRIGVMPNLRAIVAKVQLVSQLDLRRWAAVVQILFGVINDGGGIIIKPGSGPIPIDPWGPLMGAKRDVLAALAATEVAALLSDEASQKAVLGASLEAIQKAVDSIRELT